MKKAILLLTVSFIVLSSQIKAQEVVVIANKSVSESSIDIGTLTSIFLLNKVSWSDGSQIKVFDIKEGSLKSKIYDAIHKQELEIKKQWMKKKLSEGVDEPKSVTDEDAVLNAVKSTAGGIGYVTKAKATGDVKVLLVIK